MSGTALDHPLVRDYLRELDRALAGLPPAEASELREQISAHLDDTLAPDAGTGRIEAVLARLGRPADLAAEAGAEPPAPVRRRLRLPWWLWAGIVVVLTAVAVLIGADVVVSSAPALEGRDPSSWWFPRDVARATFAEADGLRQTSVPARSGQRQGLAVTVYNPSDLTQTILGQWQGSNAPGNSQRSFIAVATTGSAGGRNDFRALRYARPASIPPHQSRWVRLLWVTNACLQRGTASGIEQLRLYVRVGWVNRAEVVPLRQGWFINGPTRGRCL
jgi:hypothetical protein